MANLKPILATVAKLADRAIRTGEAGQRIAYETGIIVAYNTSLATPGVTIVIRHFETDIVKLAVRPQGLAGLDLGAAQNPWNPGAVRPDLYWLAITNGGYRSQATTGRLREILAAFGFGFHYARDPRHGYAITAGDFSVNGHCATRLHFADDGQTVESTSSDGEDYPNAGELAALKWLHSEIKAGDPAAREILAAAVMIVGDAQPERYNSKGSGGYPLYNATCDSKSIALREFSGFRRFPCATRYGDSASREALASIVESYELRAGA